MTLEYDGTNYAGWQRQLNAATVQQTIEEALERHLGSPVRVTASGRTDAGVHAMGQVISFPTTSAMAASAIGRGLVRHLPADIGVRECMDAEPGFDARRSARLRCYRFFLCNRTMRPAVGARYLTHIKGVLDHHKMAQAARVLSGEHNFSAFRAITCTARRTSLTMQPIQITHLPDDVIQIDYRCRSFLQNMVRILTGTIVAAGRNKLSLDDVRQMLETGERHQHAVTVSPNGLFLYRVYYADAAEAARGD